jgi:hypothetical protein
MSNWGRFGPGWDNPKIVLVDDELLKQAAPCIRSCEHCTPDLAWLPFECLLDQVTGNAPEVTEYFLIANALCPRCAAELQESTLIASDDELARG